MAWVSLMAGQPLFGVCLTIAAWAVAEWLWRRAGILAPAGVTDHRAAGFAMGVASQPVGTARAFRISDRAGAFASRGMILNALLTMALVPVALSAL